MKVFKYNKAVARQGRPSLLRPFACCFYSPSKWSEQAFLLSEKKRIYVVKGEGVPRCSSASLEEKAFEKYAPLRDLKLLSLVEIHSLVEDKARKRMVLKCDLYDYHEHVMLRAQELIVPTVYVGMKELWAAFREFEAIPAEGLSINKEHQECLEAEAFSNLKLAFYLDILLQLAFVLTVFFAGRSFSLFALLAGIKVVFSFKRIIKSQFSTTRMIAYAFALSLCIDAVSLFLIYA